MANDTNLQTAIHTAMTETLSEANIEYLSEEEQTTARTTCAKIANEEPDPDTLKIAFGEDFDGSFVDMTGILESHAINLAYQIQANGSIIDYLQSNKSNLINEAVRAAGLSQAIANVTAIKNTFDSLTQSIENFGTFGFSSGSNDVFSYANNLIDNSIQVVEKIEQLADYAEDIIDFIGDVPDVFDNIENYVDEKMEDINNIIASIEDLDLTNVIENLPENVVEKILGLDVVQDLFSLPKRIAVSIATIAITVHSIKAPTNLRSVIVLLKQLKSIISLLKDTSDMIKSTAQKIENLQNQLKAGNYIGFVLSVAGGMKFIERPSSYNAQYPYNQAYVTEGKHVFEVDNTPEKERLHVAHKSGSDIEIQPDGAIVTKTKNDFQLVVEENLSNHVKKDSSIIVDGRAEYYSKGSTNIEANSQLILSSPNVNVIADSMASTMSQDINILSALSTTLHSGLSTSVSSSGQVIISSDVAIILDAPTIVIGKEKTALLNLNSVGTTTMLSSGTTNIMAGGMMNCIAGIITLNP